MNIIEQKIEELKIKYSHFTDQDNNFVEDMRSLIQVATMSRTENAKIKILLSEADLQELQEGNSFDWTAPTDHEGEYVGVHIAPSSFTCADCCEEIEQGKEVEIEGDSYCVDCAKSK